MTGISSIELRAGDAKPENKEPPKQAEQESTVVRLLRKYPRVVFFGWVLVGVLLLLTVPAIYLGWVYLPGKLLDWANQTWWHWVPAFFGYLLLFVLPVWTIMGGLSLAGKLAETTLAIEDSAVRAVRSSVSTKEEAALAQLEQGDEAHLLPMLRYSRTQLETFYELVQKQARRAYANSFMAMWLGFLVLLIGISLFVVPVEKLGLEKPPENFNVVVLVGGVIIEFISALFFWVYRSANEDLTYFFNRQFHMHGSVLCYRIAATMEKPQGDEAKRAIVDQVLKWSEGSRKRHALPSSRNLRGAPADKEAPAA